MDPKNIQAVLATHVEKFGSEPLNRAVCNPLIGDGIITTDRAAWKRSRHLGESDIFESAGLGFVYFRGPRTAFASIDSARWFDD